MACYELELLGKEKVAVVAMWPTAVTMAGGMGGGRGERLESFEGFPF